MYVYMYASTVATCIILDLIDFCGCWPRKLTSLILQFKLMSTVS